MTQDKATIQTLPAILRLARDHRHPLMPAEARLWAKVRNRGLGFKIRRQHPIWRFIADFYCAEAKLVIEVDGDSHTEADQAENYAPFPKSARGVCRRVLHCFVSLYQLLAPVLPNRDRLG